MRIRGREIHRVSCVRAPARTSLPTPSRTGSHMIVRPGLAGTGLNVVVCAARDNDAPNACAGAGSLDDSDVEHSLWSDACQIRQRGWDIYKQGDVPTSWQRRSISSPMPHGSDGAPPTEHRKPGRLEISICVSLLVIDAPAASRIVTLCRSLAVRSSVCALRHQPAPSV